LAGRASGLTEAECIVNKLFVAKTGSLLDLLLTVNTLLHCRLQEGHTRLTVSPILEDVRLARDFSLSAG
jgi:hypothetical protein